MHTPPRRHRCPDYWQTLDPQQVSLLNYPGLSPHGRSNEGTFLFRYGACSVRARNEQISAPTTRAGSRSAEHVRSAAVSAQPSSSLTGRPPPPAGETETGGRCGTGEKRDGGRETRTDCTSGPAGHLSGLAFGRYKRGTATRPLTATEWPRGAHAGFSDSTCDREMVPIQLLEPVRAAPREKTIPRSRHR